MLKERILNRFTGVDEFLIWLADSPSFTLYDLGDFLNEFPEFWQENDYLLEELGLVEDEEED